MDILVGVNQFGSLPWVSVCLVAGIFGCNYVYTNVRGTPSDWKNNENTDFLPQSVFRESDQDLRWFLLQVNNTINIIACVCIALELMLVAYLVVKKPLWMQYVFTRKLEKRNTFVKEVKGRIVNVCLRDINQSRFQMIELQPYCRELTSNIEAIIQEIESEKERFADKVTTLNTQIKKITRKTAAIKIDLEKTRDELEAKVIQEKMMKEHDLKISITSTPGSDVPAANATKLSREVRIVTNRHADGNVNQGGDGGHGNQVDLEVDSNESIEDEIEVEDDVIEMHE